MVILISDKWLIWSTLLVPADQWLKPTQHSHGWNQTDPKDSEDLEDPGRTGKVLGTAPSLEPCAQLRGLATLEQVMECQDELAFYLIPFYFLL